MSDKEFDQFMRKKIAYVQNKLNTDPYVRAVLGDALNEGGWALFEALWMRQYWYMKVEQLENNDE